MNYDKIYKDLCEYCKTTTPEFRVKTRNPDDPRIGVQYLYTERHHIVPKHDGGTDEECNIVTLLPEEHFLAHFIRYKAYNQANDFISVRSIINGYMSKQHEVLRSNLDHVSMNKRIGLFRQHIQSYRKVHGWQTEDGRKRISKARMGTFPCVDVETGDPVGSHKKDHPNIISGKWVHHSKGKLSVTHKVTGERSYMTTKEYQLRKDEFTANSGTDQSGSNNSNYKDMTPERVERIFKLIGSSIIDNHLILGDLQKLLKEEFKNDFKRISLRWIYNHFGGPQELIDVYNERFGVDVQYERYFRSTRQRLNSAEFNKGRKRSGNTNKT